MLVKQRIYVSLLLLSLLPLVLISLLTNQVAENALEQLIVRDFQSLAREKADGIGRLLDARINEVRLLARHPSIIAAVQDSNSRYQEQNDIGLMEEIHRQDKAWIASKGATELAETIASNELSGILKSIQSQSPDVYGEMIVTDSRGATVAMTKTLSDYYQADEYWWQKGKTYVESGAFLDDRGYDESVGSIVIGVVVPVLYDGEVIGIFKINFRIKAILDIVSGEGLDQGYILLLARSDGSVILSSDKSHPERLATSELQLINTRAMGTWKSEAHGRKTFAAYYPMKHAFSTRDTKGAIIGIAGETTVVKIWYVVYEVDDEVVFASLQELHETAITMGVGALALAMLIGSLLSRAIFRPLSILKNGTEIIGGGNLTHHIPLKAKDEFGALAHSFNGMSKKLQETLASRDELNQEIAGRKQLEEERNQHFKRMRSYQDTIVTITTNSAAVAGDEETVFPVITEETARAMGVERVSIWLFEEEPEGMRCFDLYQQSSNKHSHGTFLAVSDYPNYFGELWGAKFIDASEANTDARTCEFSKTYLKPLNISSMLDAPIHLEGQVMGVVCYEHVGPIRSWLIDDIAFANEVAAQVAQVLSNAKRRRVEMQLEQAHGFLQDVIDSMPSVLVAVDAEGRVNQWSKEAVRMTGLDYSGAVGQKLEDALPLPDDLMHRVLAALQDNSPKKLVRQECELAGERRFMDVTVYPLTGKQQVSTVIRLDDVTERVRLESMMTQTEKMKSIGGLAAGMSHELNNPLGGILQGLQNVRRRFSIDMPRNVEAAQRVGVNLEQIRQYMEERQIDHFIDNMTVASERAANIVENLVSFIRHPDAGKQAEDIHALIDRALDLVALDYDMKKKYGFHELQIVREYDPRLMSVPCVASDIQQVLFNGLRNAAQALSTQEGRTEPGQIILRTRKLDNMAHIEVEDNGPGMDDETRRRAFEPFFTTRGPDEGIGLGLSVSYYIVHDQHEGDMRIESTSGKSAKLIIELPLVG